MKHLQMFFAGLLSASLISLAAQSPLGPIPPQGASTVTLTPTGGGFTSKTCTNQAITAVTSSSSTCSTITSAYVDSTVATVAANNVFTGRQDFTNYSSVKTAPAIAAGVLTVDLSTATFFGVSLNANITTLTISNPPATGKTGSFVLAFTADGTARTIAWPGSVKWPSGTAPTPTSTLNKVDLYSLTTFDGGTTYYALISGQNL